MKKTTVSLLLIFSSLVLTSQTYFPLDTVIHKKGNLKYDEYISINIVDTLKFEQFKTKRNIALGSKYLVNDSILEFKDYNAVNKFIIVGSRIFLQAFEVRSKKKMLIVFDQGTWKFLDEGFVYDIDDVDGKTYLPELGLMQFFKTYRKGSLGLFLIDPVTNVETKVADFTELADKHEIFDLYDGAITDLCIIGSEKKIVKLGLGYEATVNYEIFKYFIIEKGMKLDITDNVIPKDVKDNFEWPNSTMVMISADRKFIREELSYYDNNTLRGKCRIMDYNYNPVANALGIGTASDYNLDGVSFLSDLINGINKQNGSIVHYFLNSCIDYETRRRNAEVIIPYEFVTQLEIAMYNAYNNKLLGIRDIEGLKKLQLGILRNLIFAKHNYKFDSEFYQAYFNLFAFYNNETMMNSRTKEITHLLTPADKANIELIKLAEEKANK